MFSARITFDVQNTVAGEQRYCDVINGYELQKTRRWDKTGHEYLKHAAYLQYRHPPATRFYCYQPESGLVEHPETMACV